MKLVRKADGIMDTGLKLQEASSLYQVTRAAKYNSSPYPWENMF